MDGNNGTNGVCHDCSSSGHEWFNAPEPAIVPHRCNHCPAIGFPCPECAGVGAFGEDRMAPCMRCLGTGTIEVVEISRTEVSKLRVTERRFTWMLKEFAFKGEMTSTVALREIDELLAIGAGEGKIGVRPVVELLQAERAKRAKKPRAD